MKDDIFVGKIPSASIVMVLGMAVGALVCFLLNNPITLGTSFGMGIGIALGICLDKSQSKRTKLIVATFFGAVLLGCLILLLSGRAGGSPMVV